MNAVIRRDRCDSASPRQTSPKSFAVSASYILFVFSGTDLERYNNDQPRLRHIRKRRHPLAPSPPPAPSRRRRRTARPIRPRHRPPPAPPSTTRARAADSRTATRQPRPNFRHLARWHWYPLREPSSAPAALGRDSLLNRPHGPHYEIVVAKGLPGAVLE